MLWAVVIVLANNQQTVTSFIFELRVYSNSHTSKVQQERINCR